tara:strand:+ start:224 stop:466 length:243 start_codon:yes stop_codon:yes gene_type:complete
MQKIRKLTPDIIKKIITEEKAKIQKEVNESRIKEQKKLLAKLKLLKKAKEMQKKSLREAKELHILKKKIVALIKGEVKNG